MRSTSSIVMTRRARPERVAQAEREQALPGRVVADEVAVDGERDALRVPPSSAATIRARAVVMGGPIWLRTMVSATGRA